MKFVGEQELLPQSFMTIAPLEFPRASEFAICGLCE